MAYIETVKNKKKTTYRVFIKIKGYKPVTKTFDKKTEAKEWAAEVERQMKKGKYRQIEKTLTSPILTVKDLIDYFEENSFLLF